MVVRVVNTKTRRSMWEVDRAEATKSWAGVVIEPEETQDAAGR